MIHENLLDIVIPVYNDASHLPESLTSISKQLLPANWNTHVYIVDDGSDVPVTTDLSISDPITTTVITLESNGGASVARNRGAKIGTGEVILFLDADCSLLNKVALMALLTQYRQGSELCFGQIQTPHGDFWSRYQNEVAIERATRFREGEQSSMTTAIFMTSRTLFESIGGFDESYHFGFEDRDLFISLIKKGANAALIESALVCHNDNLSLTSVTRKLYKSAATSSNIFIAKHPKEYASMNYSKADVRYSKGCLGFLVFITSHLLWPLVAVADWSIKKNLFPYFVSKKLVQYLSSLAYLHGTKRAASELGH